MSPPHFLHFIGTTPFLKYYICSRLNYSKTNRFCNRDAGLSFFCFILNGTTRFFVMLQEKNSTFLPFLSINAD
ncbi:hypothetical protein BH09DEP1_BH09DEP1_6790 [soil metagenome]